MSRGRVGTIVITVLVVGLIGFGIWKRQDLTASRDAADHARIAARHELAAVDAAVAELRINAASTEADNADTATTRDELLSTAESVAGQIQLIQRGRDDTNLAAWFAGGQVTAMRECLAGINQALNQVSVNDGRAVATLAAVRTQCRDVGA